MAISKNVNFKATVQGVTGVLRDFKKMEDGGKNIFKSLRNEAKLFVVAFSGVMGASIAIVDRAVQKFAQWEKQAANTNRMMKLSSVEYQRFISRVENSIGGGGALAVLPDAMNQIIESLYDYTSALGPASDGEAVFRDIEAAAMGAAISGSTLNAVMSDAARIARTAGLAHGELGNVINALTAGEQDAIGTLTELSMGTNRAIGPMRNLNATYEETIGFLAQLSGTGIGGMTWAARALKAVGTRFERNRKLLKDLGVESEDFIGMMRELADIDLTPELKETLFGGQWQAFFSMMLDRIPALDATINKIRASTGLLNEQFNAFTYTTISEQTRATNELEMAQIKLGQRMKELGPIIANIKTELQLTVMEFAEWAINHPAQVASIVMGLMAIRAAYLAMKTSSPWGLALAAIELTVGGIIALIDALDYSTRERLADVRASKQQLEEQRAAVDQTQAEVKARLDQARATGASTERMAELNEQYQTLVDNSERLTEAISIQTIAEAQLVAQLEAETAANEVGTQVFEKSLGQRLTLEQQSWKTQADRLRIQEAITNTKVELVNALGDESKINEAAIGFLKEAYNLSEQELVMLESQIDSREEVEALIKAAQAGIDASLVMEGERLTVLKRQVDGLYDQAGMLDTIQDLEAGTITITADGYETLLKMNQVIKANAIERAKEMIIARMANASDAQRLVVFQRLLAALEERFAVMDQRLGGIKVTAGFDVTEPTGVGVSADEQAAKMAEADAWNEYLKDKVDELNEYRLSEAEALLEAQQQISETNIKRKANFEKTLMNEALDLSQERWQRGMELVADGFIATMEGGAGEYIETLGKNILKNSLVMLLLEAFDKGTFTFGGLLRGILPGFAEGALVTRPTLGIFGERGPEYLIPQRLMDQRMQEYGALGAAIAAAEVSGQSIGPAQFTINESQPNVSVVIAPEGILRLVEKGQRARVVQQGQ